MGGNLKKNQVYVGEVGGGGGWCNERLESVLKRFLVARGNLEQIKF